MLHKDGTKNLGYMTLKWSQADWLHDAEVEPSRLQALLQVRSTSVKFLPIPHTYNEIVSKRKYMKAADYTTESSPQSCWLAPQHSLEVVLEPFQTQPPSINMY